MQLKFGEKIVPTPVVRENDADTIFGPAWRARREGGEFVLDYATGDLANRERRFVISASEFGRLRADPAAFDEIVRAHGG